jgi:hypothetical protein
MRFRFRPILELERAELIQCTLAATTAQKEHKQ